MTYRDQCERCIERIKQKSDTADFFFVAFTFHAAIEDGCQSDEAKDEELLERDTGSVGMETSQDRVVVGRGSDCRASELNHKRPGILI